MALTSEAALIPVSEPDQQSLQREVAERLAAPAPPHEGALAPNATGYLLGVGGRRRQIYPLASRLADRATVLAPVGGMLAIVFSERPVGPISFALASAALPLLPMVALSLWAWGRCRAQLARAKSITRPATVPSGTLVRLVGVVCTQPTVPALFSGEPAVLSRNRAGAADETRGIDFQMALPHGERVRVAVTGALLMDQMETVDAEPACGPVSSQLGAEGSFARLVPAGAEGPRSWHGWSRPRFQEASIGPGDEIEVCGVLEHQAAPDGERYPGRGTPVRSTIRGTEAVRVLVRSL